MTKMTTMMMMMMIEQAKAKKSAQAQKYSRQKDKTKAEKAKKAAEKSERDIQVAFATAFDKSLSIDNIFQNISRHEDRLGDIEWKVSGLVDPAWRDHPMNDEKERNTAPKQSLAQWEVAMMMMMVKMKMKMKVMKYEDEDEGDEVEDEDGNEKSMVAMMIMMGN